MRLSDRIAIIVALAYGLVVFVLFGGFSPDQYMRQDYAEAFLKVWGVPSAIVWLFLRVAFSVAAHRDGARTISAPYRRL